MTPLTHRRALAGLVGATALWGVSFPIMKCLLMEQEKLVPGAGTWFFSAWMMAMRFSLGALVLLPWMWRGGIRRAELRQGMTLALWGGLGMWFQSDALGHTSASVSAFLTQGYCVFLPLWFALRHRRRPDGRTVLATAMVVLGVARLSGVTPSELRLGRGEWETLVAAFLFTFQILALGDPHYDGNRSLRVTFVMFAGIAVLFWPIALVAAPPQPGACGCRGLLMACGRPAGGLDHLQHAWRLRADEPFPARGDGNRGRLDLLLRAGLHGGLCTLASGLARRPDGQRVCQRGVDGILPRRRGFDHRRQYRDAVAADVTRVTVHRGPRGVNGEEIWVSASWFFSEIEIEIGIDHPDPDFDPDSDDSLSLHRMAIKGLPDNMPSA